MTKETGGPAFPVADIQSASPSTTEEMKAMARGMHLRDHFAGLAMQGELACQHDEYQWHDINKLAAHCYNVADAMLKARKQ